MEYNVTKNYEEYLLPVPPGTSTNSVHWFQKLVAKQSVKLKRDFSSLEEWKDFKTDMIPKLKETIGYMELPPMKECRSRGAGRVGDSVLVERIDVYMDDDYAIPTFVFSPFEKSGKKRPAIVWNPGWPQDKWHEAYCHFAERMAKQGFVVLIMDHAPFGECTSLDQPGVLSNVLANAAGMLLGYSQLAVRATESIRCKEYLKQRPDVDPERIIISGLCQGGMDTYFAAAVDEEFYAAAPFCSTSTFTAHMTEMSNYRINGDASPFPFGILKVCDIEHLFGCIAPRPLLVRSNLPDNWWPVSGYNDLEAFSTKIYELYGAADKMDFKFGINEHDLTNCFADDFEKWLLEITK